MKQAIEEGFILDVLANYTTYKSYYEIQKSIEDNPCSTPRRHRRSCALSLSAASRRSIPKPRS
ncbi:MAG: hypothetical protein M5R42_21870 [Rhodocyclaceae bacterium]|nr:hypothetical protein [Rhodocyclaceae bacterium]